MYDINLKVIKQGRSFSGVFFIFGLFFGIMIFMDILDDGFTEMSELFATVPFFLVPAIFIGIGVINFTVINKRIKVVKELNKTGKLIKGLPYKMEKTGEKVNGRRILRPVVLYKLPNGEWIKLIGDNRYDYKDRDEDGFVDIVIDENDYNNYFIDFEINRIEGNRPEDYFKLNK